MARKTKIAITAHVTPELAEALDTWRKDSAPGVSQSKVLIAMIETCIKQDVQVINALREI